MTRPGDGPGRCDPDDPLPLWGRPTILTICSENKSIEIIVHSFKSSAQFMGASRARKLALLYNNLTRKVIKK